MECRDSFSVFILHYIPILLSHSIRIQLILRLTYLVSRILFMFGIWMFPFYKTDVLFRSISSFSFVELSSTVKCQKWFFLCVFLLLVVQSLRIYLFSCFAMRIYLSQFFFLHSFQAFYFSCHQLWLCLDVSLCVFLNWRDLFWFVVCCLLAMCTIDLTMFEIFAFFITDSGNSFPSLVSSLPLFNLTLCKRNFNTQMSQSILLHTHTEHTNAPIIIISIIYNSISHSITLITQTKRKQIQTQRKKKNQT